MEALGIEPPDPYAPIVVDRSENVVTEATKDDAKQHEVSAASGLDAIEIALAKALTQAASAQRFDVVAQLARELEARRLARTGNVVRLRKAER